MDQSNPTNHTDESRKAGQSSDGLTQALGLLGQVLGLSSLVVALLYYFGWARTSAEFHFFGVDVSLLGLTTQDYLLRSVQVTWQLARWILVAVLLVIWVIHSVSRSLEMSDATHPHRRGRLAAWTIVFGILVLVLNVVSLAIRYFWLLPGLVYPISWTAGICLVAYGVSLSPLPKTDPSKDRGAPRESVAAEAEAGRFYRPTELQKAIQLRRTSRWLFVGLLVISLFWIVALFASQDGRTQAYTIEYNLSNLPNVTVYSPTILNLQAPGVTFDQVCQVAGSCVYRYTGLKMLVRASDRFFLLPSGWSEKNPVTIILPDTSDLRIEVAPGTAPAT